MQVELPSSEVAHLYPKLQRSYKHCVSLVGDLDGYKAKDLYKLRSAVGELH